MGGEKKNVDLPQAILTTQEEKSAGAYSPLTLQRVLSALHRDGLVVLKEVIDTQHIDAMNQVMCQQADQSLANPNKTYNHNVRCKS
jgi:hypothetical protein